MNQIWLNVLFIFKVIIFLCAKNKLEERRETKRFGTMFIWTLIKGLAVKQVLLLFLVSHPVCASYAILKKKSVFTIFIVGCKPDGNYWIQRINWSCKEEVYAYLFWKGLRLCVSFHRRQRLLLIDHFRSFEKNRAKLFKWLENMHR